MIRSSLRFLPVGALLAACTTVRAVQPTELSPPHAPARVWVTRVDHATMVFDSARVNADTLVGVVNGAPERLPLSETTILRAREPSGARTGALVIAVGGAAAFVVYEVFADCGLFTHCSVNITCATGGPDGRPVYLC